MRYFLALCFAAASATLAAPADRPATLGEDGVLRWSDTREEVALFGVNYYVPFAIDYQRIQARGLDHRQAIGDDLEHLRRLGLDALRLHCWDREISDREGNLLDNEHLELLDFLVAEAKARGIYTVLTPIAWWGTGNPADGFSCHYPMHEMTTGAAARQAQRRYLAQFVAHRNRFTGQTYRDDPAVIAFEVINEPLYPPNTTDAQVTEYIDALVDAVRSAGCTKPVAYNCWAGRGKAAAAARCDALTFGWYPTGLVSGHTIRDNCLPRADRHGSMHDPVHDGKLKMVYEFDAADVHGSCMYPAMARTFRLGGIQIATQFQYDVLCIAAENENWQTHYLNLVYTPGKALSFAIAAEAFRSLPRGQDFGAYPANTRFGACRISFAEDLSEFVTETAFLHSNTTGTMPPAPASLVRIAGCGSSPVVESAGGGAWFLDRLSADAWLLQAYPAAIVVDDPYRGKGTEKVRPLFDPIRFRLRLPGWDGAFAVHATKGGETAAAAGGAFMVAPGEYLLVRPGAPVPARPAEFPAYVVPVPVDKPPAAMVDVPTTWREGEALPVRMTIAGQGVRDCQVRFRAAGSPEALVVPARQLGPHEFSALVPAEAVTPGMARMEIRATSRYRGRDLTQRFPGGLERDLDLGRAQAGPTVVPFPDDPAKLKVSASDDVGTPVEGTLAKDEQGRPVLRLATGGFGPPPSCASVEVRDLAVPPDFGLVNEVLLELRGAPATRLVEVGLRLADGRAFGQDVMVTPSWGVAVLPVQGMRGLWGTKGAPDLAGLASLRLTYGAWLLGRDEQRHAVELRSVTLVPGGEGFAIDVRRAADPVALAEPGLVAPKFRGSGASTLVVGGDRPGRRALRVLVPGFGPSPACASARMSVPEAARRALAGKAPQTLVVVARSVAPATDRIELVLVEADGAPWGTTVSLAAEWQEIRIPLADLTFFRHWAHPANRGGEGDGPKGTEVQSVNLCFGAWQYPETHAERHGFDIQSMALE